MSEDKSDETTVAQAIAGALTAGLGLAVGGPVGAVAGAAFQPSAAVAVQRSLDELAQFRRRSAGRMLQGSADRMAVEPDELVDSALRDLNSAHLLGEAIQTAARTVNDQKIQALARALANGIRDDAARADDEALVIAALAEIEAPHIKVLVHLGPERSRTRTPGTNLRGRTPPSRGSDTRRLAEDCQMDVPAVRAVLSVLQRAGLAVQDTTAELIRSDRLIMELQQEVNKLAELALNPPKNGKIPSNRKPRKLDRPGSPARQGWMITRFGELCLAYLEDRDIDVSPADAVEQDARLAESPPTPSLYEE